MMINDNVLFASHQVGVTKVISAMTCAALPIDQTAPVNESMVSVIF